MTEKINSELEAFIIGCYKGFLIQLSARVGDNITSTDINSMLKKYGIKKEINISMLIRAKVLKQTSSLKGYTPLKPTEKLHNIIDALRNDITLEDSKVNFRKYLPFRTHSMWAVLNHCIYGRENIRYSEIESACKIASVSMPKIGMFLELGILTKNEGKRDYSWTKKQLSLSTSSSLLLKVDTEKNKEYKKVTIKEDKTSFDTFLEEELNKDHIEITQKTYKNDLKPLEENDGLFSKKSLENNFNIETEEKSDFKSSEFEEEIEKEVYLEDKFTQKEEELFPEEEVVEDYKKLEITKEVPKRKTFWEKLMFWK